MYLTLTGKPKTKGERMNEISHGIENDEKGEHIFIDLIYVEEEDRGKGVARKMMEELIEEAIEDGHTRIKLLADPQELGIKIDRLVAFYKSFGFEIVEGEEADGEWMEMVL